MCDYPCSNIPGIISVSGRLCKGKHILSWKYKCSSRGLILLRQTPFSMPAPSPEAMSSGGATKEGAVHGLVSARL